VLHYCRWTHTQCFVYICMYIFVCVFRNGTKNKRGLNRNEIDGERKMSEEVWYEPYKHIENANEKIMRNFWLKKFIIFSHMCTYTTVMCTASLVCVLQILYTFDKINGSWIALLLLMFYLAIHIYTVHVYTCHIHIPAERKGTVSLDVVVVTSKIQSALQAVEHGSNTCKHFEKEGKHFS
jgi:hypothetical protein